ncbi:MAG: hypothetical protein PHV16_01205 [Candidatus Nanoarchaeia archaeon]|nr:hypothetical protein [Candidatus Nanoarchaeia archaeon]
MSKEYIEMKKELGIEQEFLVYFENEKREIIEINGIYCFGYDEIAIECK